MKNRFCPKSYWENLYLLRNDDSRSGAIARAMIELACYVAGELDIGPLPMIYVCEAIILARNDFLKAC